MKDIYPKIQKLLSMLPFVCIAGGIILYFKYGKDITPEQIFNLAPQSYYIAIFFILGMFAIKSVSIVFPVSVLYISSGMIFPFLSAIIINILGVSIALTVPYLIGHFSGNNLGNYIVKKYPKLQQIDSVRKNSEWFFIFIIRIIGLLPMDAVSLFMGSINISFSKHLIVSILAMLPDLLLVTFIGKTIAEPSSLEFILACILKICISIISIIGYKKHKKSIVN